jgi:hypothetical protein
MSAETRRAIRAFAMAPLAAPIAWWASVLIAGDSGAKSPLDALDGLVLIVIVAAPWAYGAALFVGVPLFLIIGRWGTLRAWHALLVASVLGSIAFPLNDSLPMNLGSVLTGASLGFAAGASFWFLARPPRDRRPSASEARGRTELEKHR